MPGDTESPKSPEEKVTELANELEQLRARLKDQDAWIQNQEKEAPKPVMMVSGMFDRMVELDPTLKVRRTDTLKGRFAETVNEEGLKRELRRLNMEIPSLSFFDFRDRAVSWLGQPKKPKSVHSQEAAATRIEETTIQKQQAMIDQQQKQIDSLLKGLDVNQSIRPMKGYQPKQQVQAQNDRCCWICRSPDHFKRECPSWWYNHREMPRVCSGESHSRRGRQRLILI